jgi:pimeloyl-ACP methyl ester carboxylesterase
MNQNRGWLIAGGCAAALVLACCIGTIVMFVVYQDEFSDFISMYEPTAQISSTSLPTPAGTAAAPEYTLGDMEKLIAENDGKPCPDSDTLTCITLTMPLDHNDPSNTKTVDVTFGIHPAEGERFGMFFQAFPGGPGGAGIGSAGSRVERFDEKVLQHYDIVFFDQRGVGLSSPLNCEKALESYYSDGFSDDDTQGEEGPDSPEEQQKLIDGSKKFADECVAEIGIDPAELKLYNTSAVIEDIDNFREAVGDEKFYIYGVSYGTTVSQMYAAAHGEHLAGMVIDGVVDLTLDGEGHDRAQISGFGKALAATLEDCENTPDCKDDFGGDDVAQAYDDLATELADGAKNFDFPLPDGTSAQRVMTFNKLEATATF